MLNGNPNIKQQPFRPPDLSMSRRMPGRANPDGYGIERLMGLVPQPVKQNAVPGFGTTAVDPAMLALMARQRTAGVPFLRARDRFGF